MNSLRSRLVVGSALVAVVPLAVVMVILSQRVEQMVRAQAAERLTTALGGLREEIRSDGERTTAKLRILARDPQLKRVYLVRSGGDRDLVEYLEERRFLLDLDMLRGVWVPITTLHQRPFGVLSVHGMIRVTKGRCASGPVDFIGRPS
jgi:hypothetical protein